MNKQELREKTLKFLKEGNIKDAIHLLESNVDNFVTLTQQDLLLYLVRYNRIFESVNNNTITSGEYETRLNRIIKELSGYINMNLSEESKELRFTNSKSNKLVEAFIQQKKILIPVSASAIFTIFILATCLYVRSDNIVFGGIKSFFIENNLYSVFAVILVILIIVFIFTILTGFLNIGRRNLTQREYKKLDKLSAREDEIKNIVSDVLIFNEEEKDDLLVTVKDKISKDVASIINKETINNLLSETRFRELSNSFKNIEDRILDEIAQQNSKATLNLVIGITATVFPLIMIVYVSFFTDTVFTGWTDFLQYYFPKISMIIFLEIFSFYFLRLYKLSLDEIKYYQNELTDINFKTLSLKSALLSLDEETAKFIIKEYMKIERNKIIKKDETTAIMERYKVENQYNKDLIDKLFTYIPLSDFFKERSVVENKIKSDSK